ncbi:MAG: 4-(cytidine 5'-diphospho)-2-C-methyl-D-erythritol kinase [Hyphomicrobiales bacterium]|nr:4-(cytidine 5'-diphospho)-2-C-methyl-D-erythritol kinase [Hyphomicrobiales bacterium]
MTRRIERAPAKVNLSLHILGRREDGFHALESLVCFSASGDILSLDEDAEGFAVSGPRASDTGSMEDNLVLRAGRALKERVPGLRSGAFHLHKYLPAAAGIGGGSSDAAAALRLLARMNGMQCDDPRVLEAAAATGSDVPVCVGSRARMMCGAGATLGPALRLPPLFAVLVNPGVAVETREVFARLNLAKGESHGMSAHPQIADAMAADDLLAALRRTRNDMEDAACVIAPVITDVLAVLGAARGCRLARMSGSGATCFGLFGTRIAASRAARSIRQTRPNWWVSACILR